MMNYNTIEDVVRDHIHFTENPSSRGWNNVYCEVCGDGTHSKGKRGGWLFDNEMCFYNCFNCGIDGNFDPHRDAPFSKNMYNILRSFNIPLKYCYSLIKIDNSKKREVKSPTIQFDEIYFPEYFYKLTSVNNDDLIAKKAKEHLIKERRIEPCSYPFYLSKIKINSNNPKDSNISKTFSDRLIIPYFVNDKIIGYEGMALGEQKEKYISIGKNVIYGYNNIFGVDESIPLFVTEGFFDAFHLNGVAVLKNKLTKTHINLLEKTNRPKIIVPDRNNEYNTLAEQAIKLEWGLSFPKIKPYKDISEAIKHYGILYVVKSCMENIKYGKPAKINLNLYNMI